MRIFYGAYGASSPLDGSDLHPLRQARLKEVPSFTTEDFEFQSPEGNRTSAGGVGGPEIDP